MATLSFNDITFEENSKTVRVTLLNYFYFELDKKLLEDIGTYRLTKESIEFSATEKRAFSRFNLLLNQGLNNLKSKLTGRKAIYIHQNSGIPLIGTNYFGIVDRGTNIIEIKPMNGCNLDCIHCSVDEGHSSKRVVDFIIEKDYIVNEFKRLVEFKNTDCIHANISGQGETLLYPKIVELVMDIAKTPNVKIISIITNGTILTPNLIDRLVKAGLTRLNISLNAVEQDIASKIANTVYPVKKVIEMVKYASKKIEVILVPVLIPSINEHEIPKIIELTLNIKSNGGNIKLGIQNFLNYRFGRNPVKEISWEKFYTRLRGLEDKYHINLIYTEDSLTKTRELPKPFKKRDVVSAKILCNGRLKNEKLAVSDNRIISLPNCQKEQGIVRVKIIRSKHNIFVGILK